MNEAIAVFQNFAGLDTTGILDNETIRLMGVARCGVKDLVGTGKHPRSKRFSLQGSKWMVKNISYNISKYPKSLDREDVDAEIARAFGIWSQHSDLSFMPTNGKARIDIAFENGEHGDSNPFDGYGGTLAHAYFPAFGGDAHFDDSETWTVKTYRGTNLFQTAAHEFGHSLGLGHSDIRSAVMAPFYREYDPTFQLDEDDVQAIQALYGMSTPESHKATEEETNEDSSGVSFLCGDLKFDAIFTIPTGDIYIFKGDSYWKVTRNGLSHGFPKNISDNWPRLPGSIDAAFTYRNGKTYFFKGDQYWRYNGVEMDGDFPKYITHGFPGIPDDLDAAVVWTGNGKLYFFKGSKFWRYDPAANPPTPHSYPKAISNWEGIPNNIDAALQYHGRTYFFKDSVYYRINDFEFGVDPAIPAYPRSTAFWWFGCRSSSNGTILTHLESKIKVNATGRKN